MSLSPIIGAASQILSLFSSSPTSSSSASANTSDPLSIVDSTGKVDLSHAAQLFSKLQDLSQSDPSQFKQITAKISSQLQTEADNSTGTAQSFLSGLANQFNTASQTGSTNAFQPNNGLSGVHHGHGHHHTSNQTAYQLGSQPLEAQASATNTVKSALQQL
jgi:hypothetical protein